MKIYRHYFKRYQVLFLTAVSCVFMEALCDLLQPTIMARIIDQGVKNSRMDLIIKYGLLMLLVTVCGAVFASARSILASRVSQSFGADLREDVFAKILRFSAASADNIAGGSLITRMTNDTAQITQFTNGMMRIFFKAPVMCLGSIILALILSPRMSIILLGAVILVTAFIVISMKLSYERFAKVQYAIDQVNAVVQEYLLGIRLVKAFGRYDDEEKKFAGVNDYLSARSVSSQLVIAYFSPLMALSINLGIVGIIWLGSLLFGQGEIEVGRVSAFISYMTQILISLIMLTNVFNMFVRTKASTERIKEILDSGEDYRGASATEKLAAVQLEFREVSFAYPNGSGLPALKDLSFTLNSGETLAVIGPTGAGKSTLAWLCLRFYQADSGRIFLNGQDLKSLDVHLLRENLSLAPQQSQLFTGTVRENIAWGRAGASSDEIAAAARLAQADDFIKNMPRQYDSMLGQGGVNLSGGQKQRIAIARALIRDSGLLILDDCTSALDAITEQKVLQGIAETAGRTVILITQRIAAALHADHILVLEKGRGVGWGKHQDLLTSCQIYKEIYDSQIGEELGR